MIPLVSAFVAVALLLRVLVSGPLLLFFQNEVVSKTWVLPYLHMAAPDLAFFFVVGLLFPFALSRHRLFPSAVLAGAGLVIGQLVLIQLRSSFVVNDPVGYLVLTAPFFGTAVGFATGTLMSGVLRRIRRKAHAGAESN